MRPALAVTAVVILAATVPIAAPLVLAHRASNLALERVKKVGGKSGSDDVLEYTIEWSGGQCTIGCGSLPAHRAWPLLRKPDPGPICFIDLGGCRVSDEDATVINGVRNCAILSLRGAMVSKPALLNLLTIAGLDVVDLRGLPIDDDVLNSLKRQRRLRAVAFSDGMVDSEAVGEFRSVSQADVTLDSD